MTLIILIALFLFRKYLKNLLGLIVKGVLLAILVVSFWNSSALESFLSKNYNGYDKEQLLVDLSDVSGEFVDIVIESTLEFVKETSDSIIDEALNDRI